MTIRNAKILLVGLLLFPLSGCRSDDPAVFSGTIEGREIPVVSQVSGTVVVLDKDEGDSVSPDTRLAKIDDKVLSWQLKEAEAARDAALAKWEEAQAGSRNQQIQQAMANVDQFESLGSQARARVKQANALLAQMEAQVAQLKSQLEGAQNTLAYQEKQTGNLEALHAAGAVSEKDWEAQKELLNQAQTRVRQLEAQYRAGLAQYEAAKNEAEAAQAQLGAAEAQKAAARAQLSLLEEGSTSYTLRNLLAVKDQAQAKVEQIREQLENTRIYPLVPGILLRRHVEVGELVKPGTLLFTVLDPKDLEITMYVPETDLHLVQTGKEVNVRVDAYPGKTFHGRVSRISEKAEFTPKNVQTPKERAKTVFAVTVKLTDGWGELKPGMPADILVAADGAKGGR